jgi:hypothetical protein
LEQLNSYYGTTDHSARCNRFSSTGSLFVAGQFSGEVFIGLNSANSPSRKALYLSKHYQDGTISFLKSWSCSSELKVSSMCVKGDSVLVAGTFSDTLFVVNDTLVNSGLKTGFVLILDTLGNVQNTWVLNSYSSEIHDVRFTDQGYIIVCGEFYDVMSIDQQEYLAPLGFNSFLAKIDPVTFQSIWVRTSNGTGTNARRAGSDKFGNIYITGSYGNGTVLEGLSLSDVQGDHNAFIASYDANGSLNWARTLNSSVQSHGISQLVTDNGEVYVGGEYEMNLEVSPFISFVSSGFMDAFFVKFDINGNVLWAGTAGGTENDVVEDIALNGSENPFFLLNGGNMFLNETSIATSGFRAPALVKMNKDTGEILWNYRIPVAPLSGIAEGYSLHLNGDRLSLCGTNRTGLYYFNEILDSPNLDDSFVALIRDTLLVLQSITVDEKVFPSVRIYPNPATEDFGIEILNGDVIQRVEIIDSKGSLLKDIRTVGQHLQFNEFLKAGVYHLRITTSLKVYHEKFMKL